MNIIKAALMLALSFVPLQLHAGESQEQNTAIEGSRASKMILVTFADRSINRVGAGVAGDHYRQRGSYQKTAWSSRIAEQISKAYGLKQVNEWPITELGVYCVVYEIDGSKTLENVLETLRQDERVETVQPMQLFHTMGTSYNDPYFRLQTNLQAMQIETAHRRATGRDIKIAVIDTGADVEHPDLSEQIIEHQDFTAGEAGRFAGDIHGTAVVGAIAAAAGNGKGIVGVAPEAKILAFKACWQAQENSTAAVCNSLTLALALNTAIRMQPQILNMSLTGPADPLLQQLIEHALAKGIAVVAAADKPGSAGGFPASLPGVIAVHAMEPAHNNAGDQRSDLSAPSAEILTTFPHNTYNFISGSSIAAAEISGVIALMLELRPDLSPSAIAEVLAASRSSNENAKQDIYAAVNAAAALEKLVAISYAEAGGR